MSKNLFEFSKEQINQKEEKTTEELLKTFEEKSKKTDNASANAQDILNKYSTMNKNELLNQLHMQVKEQKNNGTFDPEKLYEILENVGNFLSAEQKQNIKNMIDNL